jgi:hypothetical protein
MITAHLTKHNGEVEVREGLNFEEYQQLLSTISEDYVDIEIEDIAEDEEILLIENSSSIHFI